MNFRTVFLSILLIAVSFLTGCGNIKIVRNAPSVPIQNQHITINDSLRPPPPAYLQRGMTCKLMDTSYRTNSNGASATKVDVEGCWWLQRGPTGRQSECRSHSTFTTHMGRDSAPGNIPVTFLKKTTNCSWSEGRGKCKLWFDEDAKLIPEVKDGVLVSYRKVYLKKPTEGTRCR